MVGPGAVAGGQEESKILTGWAVRLVFALTVAKRRDHEGLDGGELEHGWAGAVEIDAQRPTTDLAPDPALRKWAMIGVVGACVSTVAFLLLSVRDAAPERAAELPAVERPAVEPPLPSQVEPPPTSVPAVEQPARVTVAAATAPPKPKSPPPPPSTEPPEAAKAGATLANGSSAAVQSKPRTRKPAATPKPPTPTKPAQPAPPTKPAPAQPAVPPAQPAQPAQPPGEPLPNLAPESDLPDVEGWDDADEAAREQATPS